jgi:endo-1,4-beta-mannosidase
MRKFALVALALAIALLASRAGGGRAKEDRAGFVALAQPGPGFQLSGRPWHPFGCNYFDPHVGWAPKLWREFDAARVEEHFRIMRDLGVNVVRVFLTAQTFFPDGETLDPEALKKFDALLDIARRHQILVHPTGPDHWEGTPEWRRGDIYTDPRALAAQVRFWQLFAARYRAEPAIFAYDLLNEPHVRWTSPGMAKQWPVWLAEKYKTVESLREAWGEDAAALDSLTSAPIPPDQAAPGSKRLLDYQRFRESIADRWVRRQVEAIRKADPNHLVTVGLIQWSVPVLHGRPSQYAAFRPSRLAPRLDFLTVHFYPLQGNPSASPEAFERNRAYLEFVLRCVAAGDPRKPLVVGEFGWNGGSEPNRSPEQRAEAQKDWCVAAVRQGAGIAQGWLNWAYADTPSARDMTIFSGLVFEDGRPKPWGLAFKDFAGNSSSWFKIDPRKALPKESLEFDFDRAIVDPKSAEEALKQYFEKWQPERSCGLKIK